MASDNGNLGEYPIQCPDISSTIYNTSGRMNLNARFTPYSDLHTPTNSFRPIHRRLVYQQYTVTEQMPNSGVETRTAVISLAIIFVCSISALAYIYISFPELEPEEKKHIKIPWHIDDAKRLGDVMERYKDRYYPQVLTAFITSYIFLQTFAIPGSISLSILSGFLFPYPLAMILVCFCSATGATLCYFLSYLVGRRLVIKYYPERAAKYAALVEKHKDHILNYVLFLRVTPFLPNWFINIAAPVINVPLFPFWFGTFVGVAPPSFVAIQAGQTLHELTSTSGTWSWSSVALLAVFSILSLLPVFLRNSFKHKFD